jgi:hypothetical protein
MTPNALLRLSCSEWPGTPAGSRGGPPLTISMRDACPEWGSQLFKNTGHTHNGKQHHQGKACDRQFVVDATNRVIDEEPRTVVERLFGMAPVAR